MRRGLGLAIAAAVLVSAPTAQAATFHVDDDVAASGADCTNPATACKTIGNAVTQARANSEADVMAVRPGTYLEQVILNNVADDGLTIEGAGDGTVVRHPGGGFSQVIANQRDGVTLRRLALDIPGAVGATGISNSGDGVTVTDVLVTGTNDNGISLGGVDGVVERTRVVIGGTFERGIVVSGTGNEVRDSSIVSPNQAVEMGGTNSHIMRSVLRATNSNTPVLNANGGNAFVDSSLLTGGNKGARSFAGGTVTKELLLRGVTIDVGTAKVADEGMAGVEAAADTGGTSNVVVESSIIVEQQRASANGVATVTCSSSDVPDQVATSGNDSVACGNAAGNTSSSPSALFNAGDWRLAPGSPAIDSGSAAPLAPGESATDLDGNPRVLDGNLDGTAVRDKGAYELVVSPPLGTVPPPPVDLAPALAGLRVTNKVFRVAPLTAQRRRRARVGTRFLYALSEAASVRFTIERRTTGRRVGRRCRRATRRNRKRRRCVRYVRAGAFSQQGRAGANSRSFNGRFGRRALRPGRYRASVVATDAGGKRSAVRRVSFRVVRR